MQQPSPRYFRLTVTGILFSVLSTALSLKAVSAHTIIPHGVIAHHFLATPQLKTPHSYMKVDKQGQVIFSPDTLHCYAQVQSVAITNTTGQTIDLYLNGVLQFSMPPGDEAVTTFNNPGTDIFTIPNTDPNTQLTVTVKPYTTPNSDLKSNQHGMIVFSPQKLSCSYYNGACVTITNMTPQKVSVYFNGVFDFIIYPNQVYTVGLGTPGTYTFTIPNTNPHAQLTVTGK